MLSTAIFVYAATSPVNGYFGGSLYAKQGGKSILTIYNFLILLSQDMNNPHTEERQILLQRHEKQSFILICNINSYH